MRRKLAEFSLISFLSFCFFTLTFHAVASAQTAPAIPPPAPSAFIPTPTLFSLPTPETPVASSPQINPSIIPTPTLFDQQSAQQHMVMTESLEVVPPTDMPTLTPTLQPTVIPSTIATPFPTEIPTVVPTLSTGPSAMPTPTSVPTVAVTSPTDIPTLFTNYSNQYHVDVNELKKIAQCESGFNPNSNNSGLYLGMFQFAASSWASVRARMGLDSNPDLRTNAEESIRTAAYMIANGQISAWPNCK